MSTKLDDLHKVRNFVRIIVAVGITASIAANVLGAEDYIAAAIAGWPPVALLLSLEVLTRVPTSRRLGAFGRIVATIGVAFASGWLSYWHMAATVSQHGEHGGSQYIWPLSVDGLMTIASIALVELGARIRQIETAQDAPLVVAAAPAATPAPVIAPIAPMPVPQPPAPMIPAWARTAPAVSATVYGPWPVQPIIPVTPTRAVAAAAPQSPGMPPVQTEPAEVLAFRRAQAELRRTSRLSGLNRQATA